MEIIATQKYVRQSPEKIRLVTRLLKNKKAYEAVDMLPFIAKRASDVVSKVIKSALANGVSQGVNREDMIIKEIQVSEGPMLKRGRPVSRGRWHPYKKRMSHIKVVLGVLEKANNQKEDKKEAETKLEPKKEVRIPKQTKPKKTQEKVKELKSKK